MPAPSDDILDLTLSDEAVGEEVRRSIDLDFRSELRSRGIDIEIGDYPWSSDGQLIGMIIDGVRYTLTLQRLPDEAASC